MTPDDLSLLLSPGTPAISPDGATVVYSAVAPDLTADEYVGHLWSVPADGSAAPRPLTRGHRDTAPAFSPDGRFVAFLRAEPKGRPQLHVVEAAGGEPVRLTAAPLGVSDLRWSPDGSRLVVVARVPDEGRYVEGGEPGAEAPRLITTYQHRADGVGFVRDRRQHLAVVDLPLGADGALAVPRPVEGAEGLGAGRAITSGDLDVVAPRWAPDGRHVVAVAAVHQGADGDLRADAVLVDADGALGDGAPGRLVPLTDAAAGSTLGVLGALPAADGTGLWLLAQDLGPGGLGFIAAQTALYRLDLPGGVTGAPGEVRRLTDPETLDLTDVLVESEDDVLVADQRRGAVVLLAVPRSGGAPRVLLDDPAVVRGASAAAGVVAVSAADPTSSGEVLVLRLGGGDVAGPTVLTDLGGPLRARVRVPRAIETAAPDGYPVHGWVTLPDPERFGAGPYPTLLLIHGGPFSQYTTGLFDEVQVAVGAGYAVVHGNPRGSSGYGAAHGRAITGAFGTVDTDDVLALLDAALDEPGSALDRERVGVMGGSYGGYLTAWLTTRTHRFRGAIVERGFLDPVSFVGSSDIGWFFGLEYLGDAATPEEAAAVAAQSPMAHVGEVRTPTLVIHSEQDWRCPVEQGQRWFVELKRRGVPVELLLFPGEGHELTRSGRPSHRRARFEHVLRWWGERLA